MASLPSMSEDEAAVRGLAERRADALRTRSATETLATQTEDYVQYPLSGPLEYSGDTAMGEAEFVEVFSGFSGEIDYSVKDLHVTMGDRVAVTRSLSRISATLLSGDVMEMWFRKTLVLVKVDGSWLIDHEHESVPMGENATAAVGLTP